MMNYARDGYRQVLVIGGSGAIGTAIVNAERARGANVTATYRKHPETVPGTARKVHLDISGRDWDSIRARCAPTRGRWSAVYIAAGDPSSREDWPRLPKRGDRPEDPLTESEWVQEAEHGLRELRLALLLRDVTNGPIVIVGSSASRWTMPGASPYAATHGAIDGATRSWMAEAGAQDHGARIVLSRPGIVWGPIWLRLGLRQSDLAWVRRLSTSPERYAASLLRHIDSGSRAVHAGTWDATLTRWLPPALVEWATALAMGWLLRRRS